MVSFVLSLIFELEADELAKNIKAVTYSLEDFCKFGDELLELPFPFIGQPPQPRFTMIPTKTSSEGKSPGGDEFDITDGRTCKSYITTCYLYSSVDPSQCTTSTEAQGMGKAIC